MKKREIRGGIVPLLLFLLAAVCLLCVVLGSNQATTARPLQLSFEGEYSRDGETWIPLTDSADLSALDGDLYLRGHFSYELGEGGRLYYYQDHIGVTFYRNGTLLAMDTVSECKELGLALMPSLCGSQWSYVTTDGITAEDPVEIRLHNPHAHGNGDAYREFLNSLYNSPDTTYIMESFLKPRSLPLQIAGIMLMIAALMLLGAAAASGILRVPMGGTLWKYGLAAFFAGGFVILDTVNISFVSELVVLNTYGRQLCMMLSIYCVGLRLRDAFTGRARSVARAAMLLSGLLDGVLVLLSFTGVLVIYDTGIWWAASQLILCPLLIVCAVVTLRGGTRKNRLTLIGGSLLCAAVLLDLAGVGQSIYSHGTCAKIVFALLFVLYVAAAAKNIVTDHQASLRAKKLEKELEESRIAITLSQIQPHFLYNSLSSISALCRDAPEAQAALSDFADYLRGNMDSLASREQIPFAQELRHIETYLRLEKLRFGELLRVEYDIQASDFLLPPLTVQPIVENAVKHGACQKREGGTVILRTRREGSVVTITVEDDGVGFDTERPPRDGRSHVGIQNVRSRLRQMAGGELEIRSVPGAGTTAVITLPATPEPGKKGTAS